MKTNFFATLLLLGIAHSLFSYPITPRPLRKLVSESEVIVYADVINIETVDSDNYWEDTKAIMVINEILQGKVKQDTIAVFFSPGMVCPSPAHYEKGTKVLAFLAKHKKAYFTHALSYGSKTIDTVAFEAYKKRIIEIQRIQKLKNETEKSEQTINWLIACAVNPHTRWEGVYELTPESDFMSYYDPTKDSTFRKYDLNESQILKLRAAFFEIEDLSYSDLGLIDLIAKENDTELINFLVEKLKESDFETMWYKDLFMARVADLTGRDDLRKIVRKIEGLDYSDKKRNEKANQLAQEFLQKL